MQKLTLFLCAGALSLVTGCKKNTETKELNQNDFRQNNSTLTQSLTQDDYFRAIMLADGPALSLLGDFYEFGVDQLADDPEFISEIRNFHSSAIDKIKDDHPGFISAFYQKVTSGDFDLVKSAIEDASQILLETYASIGNTTVDDLMESMETAAINLEEKYGINSINDRDEMLDAIRTEIGQNPGQVFVRLVLPLPAPAILPAPIPYVALAVSTQTETFNSFETDMLITNIVTNMAL